MNRRYLVTLAALTLGISACQGSFGSGTSAPGGVNPPVNGQMPAQPNTALATKSPAAVPTTPPGDTVTYPLSEAPKGLKCPQDQGFSCTIALAQATPAPSGSPSASPSGSASPSPTPSPTPTPTPSPTPSGSSSASPSPTPMPAGPRVTLTIAGMPKNAPKMVNPNPKAVSTVALVTLRMSINADVTLSGKVSADFTLPKEQIGGRGFAIQLYHETIVKRKPKDSFIGNYNESKLSGTTLTFQLNAPPLQIKKNETWLFVLYGDELPESASPSGSPSGSPSASPSGSPSGSPSASPSGSPSASPSASASPQ